MTADYRAALPVSAADVRAAAERLRGVAHRTPVLRSRTLDQIVSAPVLLKCENLQRVGAFKFRGAYNAIARLTPEQRSRGVVAHSSGNHAQAVALAARELGASAVIVMPKDTPRLKLDATAGYGAEIVPYDRYTEDRDAISAALAQERGLIMIPPFDHPDVIAGQGTAALELIEGAGPLETLVVPVGGGGLAAGCSVIATDLSPGVRVIGIEPEAGDDTYRSLAAGERIAVPVPHTLADGQAVPQPGELTFAINRRLLDSIVLVSDAELVEAVRWAYERLKIVLEPSGASPLAALLTAKINSSGPVGVILSGGNIGAEQFARLIMES
ncbi:threonine ammonia-lyase [Microlunatus parietis]|uniref:threonine ammonia-lyase n=1 Tax=Microlunatus parietis TaxID=682979 RepID=A0A7Y9LAH9_9ACTN|nr:pyridoxal-phosphate dependent enzyme [Microlunatus parietis]NYE70712.1 threonine dehydratase [Microlunatus parietis]